MCGSVGRSCGDSIPSCGIGTPSCGVEGATCVGGVLSLKVVYRGLINIEFDRWNLEMTVKSVMRNNK